MKIKIIDILNTINHTNYKGDKSGEISEIIQLNPENTKQDILCWCSDKNKELLPLVKSGTIIISNKIEENYLNSYCNYIIVENPRRTFQEVLSKFFIEKIQAKISETANIDKSVKLGENIFIGENVVIEKNCEIGDNTTIQHNTTIFKDTVIGKDVVIGANNTIGGIGFGYEKDENGDFQLIPHIGNVVLKDNVEIGNNTTIDRAVLGSTILEENVKIDNLVHIAHGVKIGRNSVIIANSMIAGSVKIGENTWVAPSASVLNQKTIGKNSLVGMGAVVLKDVGDNEVVAGSPAKFLKKI